MKIKRTFKDRFTLNQQALANSLAFLQAELKAAHVHSDPVWEAIGRLQHDINKVTETNLDNALEWEPLYRCCECRGIFTEETASVERYVKKCPDCSTNPTLDYLSKCERCHRVYGDDHEWSEDGICRICQEESLEEARIESIFG